MGHAIAGRRRRWPGGIIPYIINESDFPLPPPNQPLSAERLTIQNAIDIYNATILDIRPARPDDFASLSRSIVEFVAGDGSSSCSSPVGMQAPIISPIFQNVRCNPSAGLATLVHELGHAIGLFHEHQRDDREQFVNVRIENVIEDKRDNFELKRGEGQEIGPYDTESIMHYNRRTFAIDWRDGVKIPDQLSGKRPALVAFDGDLHMIHLGSSSSNDLWHARWRLADGWSDDVRIEGQKSRTTPALAVWNGELHMVHLGSTGSDTLWHTRWRKPGGLGKWTEDQPIPNQKSSAAPALAAFNGDLHMVHIGSAPSNDLWHARWNAADGWSDDVRIKGQKSQTTPALAVWNGRLHMVHLGSTGSDTLWHTEWNPTRLGDWAEDQPVFGQSRAGAPALCATSRRLHLAYVAKGSSLFGHVTPGAVRHTTYNGTEWSPWNRADNNHPRESPALAEHAGRMHAVFVGDEDRIWHSRRDTTMVSIAPASGVSFGGALTLSSGDIATINAMYS